MAVEPDAAGPEPVGAEPATPACGRADGFTPSPEDGDHTSPGAGTAHATADNGGDTGTVDEDATQEHKAADEIDQAEEIDQLGEQVAALQNELLRKQADLENFRKRVIRDKEEAIKFANSGLLLDLTGVLDDFERAISAAAQSREFASLYNGIELIEKQLLGTLERKWGLTRFDSAGQPFDPERHEALATEPSAAHAETTVLEDYQKGYLLHGRVIRAARVRVATPVDETSGAAESALGETGDKTGGSGGPVERSQEGA